MRKFAAFSILLFAVGAHASKDGLYLGIGLNSTSYGAADSDSFLGIIEDESVTSWRAEVGYIWDIGKSGGFQLGVAGAYDAMGKVSDSGQFTDGTADVELDASAFSVYFVIDQVIDTWVDFMFKVGPSVIPFDTQMCCVDSEDTVDERQTRLGLATSVGFAFFPSQHIAIELALQFIAWPTGDVDDLKQIEDQDDLEELSDSLVYAKSIGASFQYRF